MRQRTFNEEGQDDLVFVMGWGNRWTYETVHWLIEQLVEEGYRVHAFELSRNLRDFKAEWLEPVAEYVLGLDGYQLLAHSAGSLVGQALDGAENHVYLSPWWGYSPRYPDRLLDALATIPTDLPFIPVRLFHRDSLGELATDHQIATMPRWTSPSFIAETRRAQRELLQIDHDAVVFCSLADSLIDHREIGLRVPAEHVVVYDGGHELFSSPGREAALEVLRDVLADGASAIEGRWEIPA